MGRGAVGDSENVACTVVGIGVGGVTRRAEQLALVVVGLSQQQPSSDLVSISCKGLTADPQRGHIAKCFIGKAVGLAGVGIAGTLNRAQISFTISIQQICGIYNSGLCDSIIGVKRCIRPWEFPPMALRIILI